MVVLMRFTLHLLLIEVKNAFDILDISRHSPHSDASVLYLVHATNYNIPIEDRSGYQWCWDVCKPPDYSSPSAYLGQIMFPYPNFENWQTHVQIIKIFPFWIMKYTGRFTLPHQQFLCPGPIVPFHAAHFFNSTASLLSQLRTQCGGAKFRGDREPTLTGRVRW